ncbi:MAG: PilN domain-containing protein [Gluconacetobacter diazotrophicus]|nr:PilN domain-containing protein [Gluconacetobacter diazotrophicus]
MIGLFLRWWAAQLLELLPRHLFRPDPARLGALLVEPAGAPERVRVLRRRGSVETVLGQFGLDDGTDGPALAQVLRRIEPDQNRETVMVRLPAEAALRRDVFLPLAAENGLAQVLGFEMDRLTPFAAEDTFFTWTVLKRDRETGRLLLRLLVVLRAPLLPVLDGLREAGRPAAAIEIAAGRRPMEEPAALIPLGLRRGEAGGSGTLLPRVAVAACLALLAGVVVLPFVLQGVAQKRLDRQVDALGSRVAAVQALEKRINGSSAGADLVTGERRQLGDPLTVLAAVTQVLPDDTFLSDLTLRRGVLTVSGQSAGAAKLIPAFGADPHFSAPAFSAPVTRIEGQSTDLFSIRTELAR